MNEEIFHLLRSHRTVGQIPDGELVWIAAHATLVRYAERQVVSRHSEVVDGLYIVTAGRMAIYVPRPAGSLRVMEWKAGDVTGMLPYSRMVYPPGDTITEEPTEMVKVGRDDLRELARNCYELTSLLVHEMTDRARHFTVTDLRDEKLTSLGKLAAGLAHELNNPASALIRDSKTLEDHLTMARRAARSLWGAGLTGAHLETLDEFLRAAKPDDSPTPSLSALDLADREESFESWLHHHGLDTALAAELARTPVTTTVLNRLAGALRGAELDAAIRLAVAAHGSRALVLNIERAASRIHSLVSAVKGFTHLDRGTVEEPVDIAAGLEDTMALLKGKARDRSVIVELEVQPDLPPVMGRPAEINQVWMNLLDNAIHAAPESGRVGVRAAREGDHLVVSVSDDGHGIPPDVAGKIFDPFFTTKDVGEGSGLGLDIVRRIVQLHNGQIDFDSRPGRTEFRVRLPLG
jgi:signal transduction histidine kinase